MNPVSKSSSANSPGSQDVSDSRSDFSPFELHVNTDIKMVLSVVCKMLARLRELWETLNKQHWVKMEETFPHNPAIKKKNDQLRSSAARLTERD